MKRLIIPCLSLVLLQAEQVFATSSIGIMGGINGDAAYASFVDDKGNVTPIDLGIPNGRIVPSSITMASGSIIGLIGGTNGSAAYAAIVGPGNTVTSLNLGVSNGTIWTTSINNTGVGLVGGSNAGSGAAYGAFIYPGNTVSPLNLGISSGVIGASAINDSALGLIVGQNGSAAYAAFVGSGNTVNPITLGINGNVLAAGINSSGTGLIGGSNGSAAYAAFVGPGNSVHPITLGMSNGAIRTAAINSSGTGLIGGTNQGTTLAYAALVISGQSSPIILLGLPVTANSQIHSVAINTAGAGIIGGQGDPSGVNASSGFAALMAPNGSLTPLNLNLPDGYIDSVAISDSGIGLIGGIDYTGLGPAYAVLVAPGGEVTALDLQIPNGSIISVAILEAVTPTSIGSNWAVFNSQFAASFALNSHMTGKHRITIEEKNQHPDVAFLASADDNLPMNNGAVDKPSQSPNTIWFSPFGNYVHQKAEGGNPSNNNAIGGFLLGYDYSYSDLMFGGALGYAYDYISFGSGQGHGSVQEELATFYSSYEQNYLMVNFALWAGYYQSYNKRNTLSFISSKVNGQGWILSPHLEIATPFGIGNNNSVSLEPFVMFDYVNNWQGSYTEKGSSGFNLVMDSHYSSVLRSEAGLRLFEEWDLQSGKFIFGQKLSYVNQAPFHFGAVTTSFVASASSFPIAIGNSNVQNLGALEVNVSFLPWNEKYPYISLGLQAEAGSSYQSYFGGLEIGKSF